MVFCFRKAYVGFQIALKLNVNTRVDTLNQHVNRTIIQLFILPWCEYVFDQHNKQEGEQRTYNNTQ